MWYQKILEELILKINEEQQKQAKEFLALFFKGLQQCAQESIPPLVLFGLIDKMYKKYSSQEEGSVELTSFARDLTGLSIILMKAAFDPAIWTEDFSYLRQSAIQSALGLNTSSKAKPKTKVLKSREIDDWGDDELPPTIEEVSGFLSQLEFLEIKTLQAWKYNLTVDFDHLLSILISNHSVVDPAIFIHCKQGFTGVSEEFDEFICKLRLMLAARVYIKQGNLDMLQRLLHPDTYNDDTLKLLTLLCQETLKPEVINLSFHTAKHKKHFLKHTEENLTKRDALFVLNIINKHLNNNKTRNELAQLALEHGQHKIANYLNHEIEELVEPSNDLNGDLPQLVSSENEAQVLSAIQIDQLLKNRARSPTIKAFHAWENANSELLTQIAKQLPFEQFSSIDWNSITVNSLCELLEIPNPQQLLLINIVDTLIDNIETKNGGRWTSGINSEKVTALKAIITEIKAEKGLSIEDSVLQTSYLQDIMAVCHIKRNPWHFWATPNSVTEFKHLLEENNLDLPAAEMRVFI
ncbi:MULTISPECIES: hypothetical protein [Legionella]|uniref:DNA repair protein n=1 Tax=Legionella drozanskii LLAP-1 TaxID=1212489 RepID=A0A0W0SWT6_9GAMM|nr:MULTISPECIES: hypothetical protein [Legionella]KTC87822.1 DNA repair protein [Legionella drozanskii LLAP-1]PJE18237.1 MAG: hypothetical protein CK430_00475 [Legionella sp.]